MPSLTTVFGQLFFLIKSHPVPFLLISVVLYLLWNKLQPGLRSIPGPTVAAYTKFWRVWSAWRGHAHIDAIELHKKHGNLVRIAPNHISVADPKWIPVFVRCFPWLSLGLRTIVTAEGQPHCLADQLIVRCSRRLHKGQGFAKASDFR